MEGQNQENDRYIPRLMGEYDEEIVPALMEKFSYGNSLEVPHLTKIVVNMGVGEGTTTSKSVDSAAADLAVITGQKPLLIKARKSVAGFKLRAGMTVGCKVTLRGDRMYEFLDRLLSISLPRVRDFRGLSRRSFDGNGNYSMGLEEQLVFPEIDYDEIDKVRGMDVCVVTTAKTDREGEALLEALGFPFKQD
ncbi:MAG: 50S ribosomal protein L5 [Actinobacteria bacterium]|nr:50S ribosomal protein L5 [Actinomycetota bacterium]MCG2818756.1 50S ribosomal protein L5 [Actinomycetes bacterium]MBU4217690.1 50S ribosomal protein L5 [Actinomycetota bacterium]MBU4358997.1 50S ribosomal protein L5 [Actinomycetota bacterium]MBU4391662.1 50S ribosomal protein L5 [Actinomycetota bacterium]